MKLIMSIIGASVSGSAGDVTAANWKGRQYIRTRVVPANPQTAGQTSQRAAFSRCVDCFQSLVAGIKTFLDKLGADQQLSGYNVYMSDSVKSERDNHAHRIMPANRYAEALQTFAAGTGAGAAGTIDITWAKGSYLVTDFPVVWVRKKEAVGDEFETPWTSIDVGATTMDDEAFTITGLVAGAVYKVAMCPNDVSEEAYGAGDHKEATAKA